MTRGLNKIIQNNKTPIKTPNRIPISPGVILKRSPIKKEEYLTNPPSLDKITVPMAMDVDEKTPIMVSVEDVLFY